MAKNFMSAALVGAALVFGTAGMATQAFAALTDIQVAEPDLDAFRSMEADIEQLIIDNAGYPEALQLAIEDYLEKADNPELAVKAAIVALNNPFGPKSSEVQRILSDPAMKSAGAAGVGAAIATIGVNNPTVAANMQAVVDAFGDTAFSEAVQSGNDTKTASIQQASKSSSSTSSDSQTGITPENPASGT